MLFKSERCDTARYIWLTNVLVVAGVVVVFSLQKQRFKDKMLKFQQTKCTQEQRKRKSHHNTTQHSTENQMENERNRSLTSKEHPITRLTNTPRKKKTLQAIKIPMLEFLLHRYCLWFCCWKMKIFSVATFPTFLPPWRMATKNVSNCFEIAHEKKGCTTLRAKCEHDAIIFRRTSNKKIYELK